MVDFKSRIGNVFLGTSSTKPLGGGPKPPSNDPFLRKLNLPGNPTIRRFLGLLDPQKTRPEQLTLYLKEIISGRQIVKEDGLMVLKALEEKIYILANPVTAPKDILQLGESALLWTRNLIKELDPTYVEVIKNFAKSPQDVFAQNLANKTLEAWGIKLDEPDKKTEGIIRKGQITGIEFEQAKKRLGAGGMGKTYLAKVVSGPEEELEKLDLKPGQEVAIKVMAAPTSEDKKSAMREAQNLCEISHPNVVQGIDYLAEGDEVLLIMEFINGQDLQKITARTLKDGKTIDEQFVRRVLKDVAAGLKYVNGMNIIHRDINPANIMVAKDTQISKIIDFGILKDLNSKTQATSANLIKGTLGYMSPEEVKNEPLSPQSDMYSFGCTLWYALTGRLPIDYYEISIQDRKADIDKAKTEEEKQKIIGEAKSKAFSVLYSYVHGHRKISFPEKPENMPQDLYDLCRKCCDLDPKKRPQSWEEIIAVLEKKGGDKVQEIITKPTDIETIKVTPIEVTPSMITSVAEIQAGVDYGEIFIPELGIFAATSVGNKRKENQDGVAVFRAGKRTMVLVADGAGGEAEGKEASQEVIKVVGNSWSSGEELENAFIEAHRKLRTYRDGRISCLAALDIEGNKVRLFNSGDTQIYLIKKSGRIILITPGQNFATDYLKKDLGLPDGSLSGEQLAQFHDLFQITPYNNYLAGGLGGRQDRHLPQSLKIVLEEGDMIFVCSDGIYDYLPYDSFMKILTSKKNPDAKVKQLLNAAVDEMKKKGGGDNASAAIYVNAVKTDPAELLTSDMLIVDPARVLSILEAVTPEQMPVIRDRLTALANQLQGKINITETEEAIKQTIMSLLQKAPKAAGFYEILSSGTESQVRELLGKIEKMDTDIWTEISENPDKAGDALSAAADRFPALRARLLAIAAATIPDEEV